MGGGGDTSSSHHHQHHQPTPSRLGLKSAAAVGEIVEVQGGHIVRSIGRKDRHSKVCTAKGPRDRRVRLAAHTAIQFYDVQDRLGYDRPSKAVDWLIKKAKSAIDELAQLPAWHPTATCPPPPLNPTFRPDAAAQHKNEHDEEEEEEEENHRQSDSGKRAMVMLQEEEEQEEQERRRQQSLHHHNNSNPPQISSFLPPSMDSDVIADTIKSFFPMGASGESNSSGMQFHQPDNNQDLRLSLQSFQDPIMLRHHHQTLTHHHHNEQSPPRGQVLLSGIPLAFDGTPPWPDHHQFQRLPPWNPDTTTAGAATGGYMFNSPPVPQQPLLQQLLGHNQFFQQQQQQQRGPLQSSNTPSIRAWIDPSTMSDHNPGFIPIYPSSLSGIGFSGGFPGGGGFHIPARIQGDEEEHDGYSDKPSSASSDSRH
ncbi:hypothetical protein ABFS83_08G188300 [Erythranthe nasuta]